MTTADAPYLTLRKMFHCAEDDQCKAERILSEWADGELWKLIEYYGRPMRMVTTYHHVTTTHIGPRLECIARYFFND